MMVVWYEDQDLKISFSLCPHIDVRYVTPSMNKEEKEDIKKYPFINKKAFDVVLYDYKKGKEYSFKIPEEYKWDGATIPKLFWRLIGSKTDNRFLIASLIHDILCENHNYVDYDRYFADKVFERLLYVSEVTAFIRWMMFHSVDNFQKFCGWKCKQQDNI